MDAKALIDLYWAREEAAITETASKYGKLCAYIAHNILHDPQDCEECVNDTYFSVWNAIPTQRPTRFSAFIGRITRNLALKRWEYLSAAKRNAAAIMSLDELGDCVSGVPGVESELENRRIEHAIEAFLWAQDAEKRNIFIRRYWYFDSIQTICNQTGFGESRVKSILSRMRQRLREYLESEGIEL